MRAYQFDGSLLSLDDFLAHVLLEELSDGLRVAADGIGSPFGVDASGVGLREKQNINNYGR